MAGVKARHRPSRRPGAVGSLSSIEERDGGPAVRVPPLPARHHVGQRPAFARTYAQHRPKETEALEPPFK